MRDLCHQRLELNTLWFDTSIGMDASQARLLKLRLSNEVTQLETSLDHIQPNYDSVKLTLDQRRKE